MTSVASDIGVAIRDLAKIRPGPQHIVSCYIRLEVADRTRQKYLTLLKGAVAQAEAAIAGLEPGRRRPIERDFHRIMKFVATPGRLIPAHGLAIFACEPRSLFLAVPMPRVHRTRVGVDHLPHLRELLGAEAEAGPLLVAVLDRTVARFFEVTAFGIRELPAIRATATRGGKFHSDPQDSPGWGEREFHHRIETERHRHFAAIGQRLAQLDRTHPSNGIVLAGPSEETRAAARFLPPALSTRFMGTARLNPTAVRPIQVQAAALKLQSEFAALRERDLVAGLEGKVREGWAVNGSRPALRALARGQVRTLLIRTDLTGSGYRCSDSGRLVLSAAECRGEGTREPVADLVNEAIEEALGQGVAVRVIHAPELAAAIEGLAAELRFR